MNDLYLLALTNAGLCAAIVFIAVCRLNAMQCGVMWRVKGEYASYIGAAAFSAMQPWWGEWPHWGSVAMAAALLIGMASSSKAWRGDRAPAAATNRGELRNADGSPI